MTQCRLLQPGKRFGNTLPASSIGNFATRVRYDGRVANDQVACASVGITLDRVEKTIAILGLNVERLRRARERHWRALDDEWQEHHDDPVVMQAAARTELLPGADGRLSRFFTTSRTYFADVGERILAEDPDAWI